MIAAAVEYCENITGQRFGRVHVSCEGSKDELARLPEIPINDVCGVTANGEPVDYTVTEFGIEVNAGGVIHAEYIAGYEEIPAQVRQAILMLIGHWYDNRTSVMVGTTSAKVEMATDVLLRAYKRWWY